MDFPNEGSRRVKCIFLFLFLSVVYFLSFNLESIFMSPVSPVFHTEATVTNIETSVQQQQPNKLLNSCLQLLFLGIIGRVDVEYQSGVNPYPHHKGEQE